MAAPHPSPLAALVRRFRLEAGLSQEQLAEKAGLSARQISDLERGLRKTPHPETMRMLAAALALNDEQRALLFQAARPELRESAERSPSDPLQDARLPLWLLPLIGRAGELAELAAAISEGRSRLITLTGPGGVGKTRLAIEAARHAAPSFAGGVVLVDLAPVSDPRLVLSAIAQALDIQESGEQSLQETLGIALRGKRRLLLLDNFEQVIGAAPVVAELLTGAPDLRVLVTSREILRLRGETQILIEPLELPPAQDSMDLGKVAQSAAVELFVAAATSARPDFELTQENASAVAGICRQLDGLPLAIELAASRMRHFPPELLLEHFGRRMPILVSGPRDLPARQQTMRDTIAWSYDLLSPDEQALFRRVGAFPGGASLAALGTFATVAWPLELDLLDGLASLVDKNLVRERIGADNALRFTMLETIREFAAEMIDRAAEQDTTRDAVLSWALEFVSSGPGSAHPWLWGQAHHARLLEEIDNLRFAFRIAAERGDALACGSFDGVGTYLYARGLFREAAAIGEKALELADVDPIPDRLRVRLLYCMSAVRNMLNDPEDAERLAREALALIHRTSNDPLELIVAMHALGIALRDQQRYAEALSMAELSYALALTPDGEPFRGMARYALGKLSYLLDDQERAIEHLAESMHDSLRFGAIADATYAGGYLAAAHVRRRDLGASAVTLRWVIRLVRESGTAAIQIFESPAALAVAIGRHEAAAQLFAADAAYSEHLGRQIEFDPWMVEAREAVRAQLGEEAFEAASRQGRTLSVEAAIDIVMDLLDEIDALGPHRPEEILAR